ncbi:MAG: hypothetical protein JXA07_05430 [Spirochaetes bacterium]|nr:hypothetical protein [Spirochaetota bacterium]
MRARGLVVAAGLAAAVAARPLFGVDDGAGRVPAPADKKARVDLGVSIDYAWWNPVWGRMSQVGDMLVYAIVNRSIPFLKIEERSRSYVVRPAPLFGLDCDVRFANGWGLSATVGAGTYRDATVMVASLTTNPFAPSEYRRYRIDTVNFRGALNVTCRVAEWLRLSLGPLYQGYTIREHSSSYLSSQTATETVHNAGFSAGGSFDVRLIENLFFRPSASFLYLYGTVSGNPAVSSRSHSHAVGGAAEASLAYFIEKIRVTLSLGFNCVVLHYLEVTNADYLNRWDSRYGLTESITYTF